MEGAAIYAIISAIVSVVGVLGNLWITNKSNKQQSEHDEAMAALNHRYREEEAVSSFEREANFNQYQADKDKMLSAGFSPALMYGGMSPAAAPSVSSVGSNQSAGNVGRTPDLASFFGKLDPAEYSSQAIDRMNAKTMREQTMADKLYKEQLSRESIAKTIEQQRSTSFSRKLEKTLLDQEDQTLKNLQKQGARMDYDLRFNEDTRDIQIEKMQLENVQLRKEIDVVNNEIAREPLIRRQLFADIGRITAMTENYNAQTNQSVEALKGSQLDRIMKQFGLKARSTPVYARKNELHDKFWDENMRAAYLALKQAGFSEFDAANAVVWYVAENTKDVTPSLINGISRIWSSKK